MNKIISVFLNPAIDLTLWVRSEKEGEPYIVEAEESYAAGKGVNVSKALTAVGCPNLALGVIGSSNKEKFLELLKNEVKNFDITEFKGATRENITVCVQNGKIIKINHIGAVEDKESIAVFSEKLKGYAAEADYVIFGGKIPSGISKDEYIDIIKLSGEAKVIVDTSSFVLKDYERLRLFAVKPNHNELSSITGLPTATAEEVVKAARMLLPFVENVIVSRGEKGLILVNRGVVIEASLPAVDILSDIGAGDSALAGFVYAVSLGLSWEKCAAYSAAFGTAKTLIKGTGTVKKEMIEELLSKVIIKRLEKR